MVDSSGMKIKFVSELRQYDAAIMELGLEYTDKMAIPPGIVAFPLNGYCIAECTKIVSKDGTFLWTLFNSILLRRHCLMMGSLYLARNCTPICAAYEF